MSEQPTKIKLKKESSKQIFLSIKYHTYFYTEMNCIYMQNYKLIFFFKVPVSGLFRELELNIMGVFEL
jgi:hypothetical protein